MRTARPSALSVSLLSPLVLTGVALAQESQQLFRVPVVVGQDDERFETLVDLDADGDLDILGWWWQGTSPLDEVEVSARFNDGSGAFAPGWAIDVEFPISGDTDFAVGDLDGDGRDDFGVRMYGELRLFQGNGTSPPTPFATHAIPSNAKNFVLADFDQDGDDDVAHSGNTAQVWLNNGPGQPLTLGDDFPLQFTPNFGHMTVVDANGDATPDLMHIGQLGGQAVQFHFIGGGQEIGSLTVPHGFVGVEERMLTTGDVDADGDQDVVVFCASGSYALVRRTGPAAWSAEAVEVGGPATDLADIDGDGVLDGVCCGGGSPTEPDNDEATAFELSLNDGSGRFAPAFQIPGLGSHHIAGAADVDGDGDTDLVAGRVVYYADGPITGPVTYETPAIGISDPVDPIDVDDVDRDGDPDLHSALDGALANPGDGRLAEVGWDPVPPPPGAGFLNGPGYPGDWDGDGDVDLVGAAYNGFTLIEMRLVANNGSGVFSDVGPAAAPGVAMGVGTSTFDVGTHPTGALRDDLDGDGDIDIVLPHLAEVRVFWNDGSGYFTEGPVVPFVHVAAAADLNGDGRKDLIGHAAHQPAVAFSDAPQSYQWIEEQEIPGLIELGDDIVVFDFEGDGDLDLVTQTGLVMGLFLNDGTGLFDLDTLTLRVDPQTGEILFIESHPNPERYLIGADVDGNGTTDLVAGPIEAGENASHVLLMDGQGGFTSTTQVFLASAFADLDGDGDVDAIGPDLASNDVVPNPGSGEREQYGTSGPLACAVRPVLGATGPFRVGGTSVLRTSGVQVGAPGAMAVGITPSALADFPWPGVTTHLWPWASFFMLPLPAGKGTVGGDGLSTVTFTVKPTWPAFGDLFHQTFFFDPCSPSLVTASNGLRLRYAL